MSIVRKHKFLFHLTGQINSVAFVIVGKISNYCVNLHDCGAQMSFILLDQD